MKTVFLRVLEAEDKAAALLALVREKYHAGEKLRFELSAKLFGEIPGSPFAYWALAIAVQAYGAFQSLKATGAAALSTNQLSDDQRYARLWWEPSKERSEETWVPWAKGRTFARYYYDIQTVVRWSTGRSTYTGFTGTKDRPLERPASADYFFEPGLTWPRRTNSLSVSVLPRSCIFGNKGPAVFWRDRPADALLALACLLNSEAFAYLLALQLARVELAQSFEVGLVQSTPVPSLSSEVVPELAMLARRAWLLKRSLDTRTEISHGFTLPALLQIAGINVAGRATAWSEHVRIVEAELVAIQAKIDERCFALYGIEESDRRAINQGFGANATEGESSSNTDDADDDAEEETDETESTADATGLAAELVSWAVGVAFGRFDIRLATGMRPMPAEPEPFDPLPVCSPGMLIGDDGFPLSRPPAGYPLAFPENGVLVDDPGHAQDLLIAVRAVFDAVFGGESDRWWNDVAALLDPKDHDLRAWLANSFFEHHLKRYSKSRRKAPILWQLGTPSGRYSVWLYAHRLTRDSFFQLQNEVVGPKLAHEERQLVSLIQSAGGSPLASERKAIAAQGAFVEELRAMLEEVKRVAPLWNPNLDDGIVLTMAPLWRLVPQHKSWQKELKNKWDELCSAKYDWAHIAMHLWPERVVPKCMTDRSLAIAHGLEEVFWVEGADGKWTARTTPVRSIEELVNERTSSAVKAALKSLLEAPSASGNGRARGGRRAASSANTVGGSR